MHIPVPARCRERRSYDLGNLYVDPIAMTVHRGDRNIGLTAMEFGFLDLLAQNPQRTYTHGTVANAIYRDRLPRDIPRALTHVRKRVLAKAGREQAGILISSVYGLGYRLSVIAEPPIGKE